MPPCQVDLSPLSREALTAFAINTYNALIIHTLVVHGTERYKSAAGRLSFFSKVRVGEIRLVLPAPAQRHPCLLFSCGV